MSAVSSSQTGSAELADTHDVECVRFTGLPGRWYVAHTKPRQEKILAASLTRFGIDNYLPLNRRVTKSPATRRLSRSWVPVFPGYLFFNGTDEQRYRALTTNRIANVLEVANQNQLIAELTNVHFLLNSTSEFSVQTRLKAGQWGRIIAGPLGGIEGVVSEYAGGIRLTMNVTILGQAVCVEVDADNVEPIDPPA